MQNKLTAILFYLILLLIFNSSPSMAQEMYVITTSDGSQLVVRDYHFAGDRVQYTMKDGRRGSIRKEDFLSIANMIGVTPAQKEKAEDIERQKRQEILIWLGGAAVIVILYVCYLFYVSRGRKKEKGEGVDICYGRIEKEPTTQGHLAFTYREWFRCRDWTIDVRRAYEEDDILFIEGICTGTGRRKTFRADRVAGDVLDRSSEHRAPMAHFFVDAEEGRG